jgi:hypothetical protein
VDHNRGRSAQHPRGGSDTMLKSNGPNSISKDTLRDEDCPWLINCTTQEYLVNVGLDSHFNRFQINSNPTCSIGKDSKSISPQQSNRKHKSRKAKAFRTAFITQILIKTPLFILINHFYKYTLQQAHLFSLFHLNNFFSTQNLSSF